MMLVALQKGSKCSQELPTFHKHLGLCQSKDYKIG
jgi:hypothetical protein